MDVVGTVQAAPGRIADYQIVRELGEGNHGRFYLARPPARLDVDEEFVALKVFAGGCTEIAYERSVRELRAFAAVRSPHLAPVYDAVLEDNFLYAMQYFPAGSLAAPARPLSRGAVLRALADAARGAHDLHEAGMAHGDISPANILIEDGGGRLSDLGLARFLAPGNTVTGMASTGSVEFIEPSVLKGERPSRASEVWALGATAHRTLTGTGLYGDLSESDPLLAVRRVMSASPRIADGIGDAERAMIAGCLAPVETRWPTAATVADRLQELVATEG